VGPCKSSRAAIKTNTIIPTTIPIVFVFM
jgi:hypothetical protein